MDNCEECARLSEMLLAAEPGAWCSADHTVEYAADPGSGCPGCEIERLSALGVAAAKVREEIAYAESLAGGDQFDERNAWMCVSIAEDALIEVAKNGSDK